MKKPIGFSASQFDEIVHWLPFDDRNAAKHCFKQTDKALFPQCDVGRHREWYEHVSMSFNTVTCIACISAYTGS